MPPDPRSDTRLLLPVPSSGVELPECITVVPPQIQNTHMKQLVNVICMRVPSHLSVLHVRGLIRDIGMRNC